MAGVRVLFCLLCLVLHLGVKQADAAKKVSPINYQAMDQRIRVKRERFYDVSDCKESSRVDGFSPLKMEDYKVQFLHENGKYSVKVSWQPPQGINNNSLVGYWFIWLVARDTRFEDISVLCTTLSAQNTSFVMYESRNWKKDQEIEFAIHPLPTKNSQYLFDKFTPNFNDVQSTSPVSSTSTSTMSSSTISSSTIQSTNTYKSAQPTITFEASIRKKNKGKDVPTIVTVAIACAAVVSLVGIILIIRHRGSRYPQYQPDKPRDPGYIYVSYIPESEGHVEKVRDFSSWLRKHGYNVQMDIMTTSNNLKDLKELGRLRWGQQQLLKAKNVFIIVSPSYLNLCRLDEGKTDAASSLTQEETIVYSEITQIHSELSSTAFISSRFIPVLFDVKETDLPFWIKQRVVYRWPDDKMNSKLLYRMNDETSYENEKEII